MFTTKRPYRFHFELTDRCNAGCPMCGRTDAARRCLPDKSVLTGAELSLSDIEAHFTASFCKRVDEVLLGGALGDPAVASDCLGICELLTDRGVRVTMSSNGSIRKPDWWTRLGHAFLRTGSKLEMHIDGLADTNPLYRVRTDFDRIIANSKAYIDTGAEAEWVMLLFRHNQHQVSEIRGLAREMGFRRFTLVDTGRFGPSGRFPYQMPDGTFRELEEATVRGRDFADGPPPVPVAKPGGGRIDCKAARNNYAYIGASGDVSACCWLAGSQEEAAFHNKISADRSRWNIHHRPLEEILHDEPFASAFSEAWREDALPTCRRKCGKMHRNVRTVINLDEPTGAMA